MRRIGPRGSLDFERISWDQAFESIVERLQETKRDFGPEATAIYTGRGSFDMALCDIFQPAGVAVSSASSVLFPFGSPNTLGVGALCYVSFAMIASHVTMGEMLSTMETDLEQPHNWWLKEYEKQGQHQTSAPISFLGFSAIITSWQCFAM